MSKEETNMEETVEYSEIMERSFVDYAINVIVDRAIPDIRDGLKPVQRRILYDMFDLKLLPDKSHKKCGRIVGDTMGRFHAHGDSSIYEALVRMSQAFKTSYPLVDIHGNGGSIDGDPAAAMRYTEARLSVLGYEMLKILNDKIVPFVDNYDSTETEPTILPTLLPNLFLLGVKGLAVGMSTEIPTHNLGELIDAILAYMGNKKITTHELMKYVTGPDYPTGGIIVNKKDLLNLYETGNGKITIRSKIEIESGTYGKTNLIIKEIPYTFSGNKMKLLENIISLIKEKKLDEISEVRDESEGDIRIVLEIKKGVNIDKFLKKLYAKSKLEDTQNCNFLVVKGTELMQIGLLDYIKEYVAFQQEIYTNKYNLLLGKERHELEILEGLCMAYDQIDAIIETIRYSKNLATAKKCLMTGDITNVNYKTKKLSTQAKKFAFTDLQAQTILDMKLQRLNGLEITAIEKNKDKCLKNIEIYEKILANKRVLNNIIKKDLKELKEQYGIKRRTKIVDANNVYVEEKPKLVEEELTLLTDRFGYVKTVDRNVWEKSGEDIKDSYKYSMDILNTDKLIVITNAGNLYQVKVSDIPKCKMKDKGTSLPGLCKMASNEEIMLVNLFDKTKELLFVFSDGYLKKVKMEEYESRQKKIVGTKLYNNTLSAVVIADGTLKIKGSKKTYSINTKDIPLHKKGVKGNKLVKLKKDETIESVNME